MQNKKIISALVVGVTIASAMLVASPAFAKMGPAMPQITGNGQPIVAGKITAMSGATITITNASNVTYTIDASNAKFVAKGVINPSISTLAAGDMLVVQGIVNGNSVAASLIIDQKALANANAPNNGAPTHARAGIMNGFMGGAFHSFGHLFGF